MNLWISLFLMTSCIGQTSEVSKERELFVDPSFERGFMLTAATHPVPKVEIGVLQTTSQSALEPPVWRMPQWATRFLLEPGACALVGNGKWAIENLGKRVVLERGGGGISSLTLEARGIAEYDSRMRAFGEAWPHLLIEQCFNEPIWIAKLKRLNIRMEIRVTSVKPAEWASGKMDKSLHTAQASAFWTVNNVNRESPGYPDMMWFGIPLFDARHEVPPAHYAIDGGKADASGKFICLLDGKRFWTGGTGDGQWRNLDADLVSLIREGLKISQDKGYLKNSTFDDMGITSFNLGWELPGPYNAALEVRGLSMAAVE